MKSCLLEFSFGTETLMNLTGNGEGTCVWLSNFCSFQSGYKDKCENLFFYIMTYMGNVVVRRLFPKKNLPPVKVPMKRKLSLGSYKIYPSKHAISKFEIAGVKIADIVSDQS